MRALIYARLSKDSGKKGDISVEDQVRRCRERATDEGLKEVLVFSEGQGVSASKNLRYKNPGSRPALDTLIKAVQPGDVVLAWEVSRLGRDDVDPHLTARDILDAGGHVLTLDGTDSRTGDHLGFGLRVLIYAEESRRMSDRTRAGKRRQRADGRYLGSQLPYGFRKDAVGRLEPEPEEAAWVRKIVDRVIEGVSYRAIGDWLNDQEVPSRSGKPWSGRTVSLIVNRPYLKDIVGEDDALRVQATAKRRSRDGNYNPRTAVLTGVLKCGRCGRGMVYDAARQRSAGGKYGGVYRCHGISPKLCQGVTASGIPCEDAILDRLVGLFRDLREDAEAEALADRIRERLAIAEDPAPEYERDALRGRLLEIEQQLDGLAEQFRSKAIDASQVARFTEPLVAESQDTERQLADIVPATTRAFDRFLADLDDYESAHKVWPSYPIDDRRNLILAVWPDGVTVAAVGRTGRRFDRSRLSIYGEPT